MGGFSHGGVKSVRKGHGYRNCGTPARRPLYFTQMLKPNTPQGTIMNRYVPD